jgi:serine/threonine protein phosphatase 1
MRSLHRFASAWEPAPRPAPAGVALFAVGDVHGYREHLEALLGLIDAAATPARGRGDAAHLVLIGDYVDRGPDSLGVLDRVLALREAWGPALHPLRGNHDRLLADLASADRGRGGAAGTLEEWRRKGGDRVLRELGLRPAPSSVPALRERLGPERRALLVDGLLPSWRSGAWLFVHAGVHPRQPLEAQRASDWLTLREPFLAGAGWSHDFAVVHGHTVRGPEVLPHRVGIDSGCYRTGVLTAVEIAGDRLRFLCVSERPDLTLLADLPGGRQARAFEPL